MSETPGRSMISRIIQTHRVTSVAILSLLLLSVSNPEGQPFGIEKGKPDPLTQPVVNYRDAGRDFSVMVDRLMQKYGIPMGMDLEIPSKHNLISVHISRGTVADVLDAILAQEPRYEWTETNGVVNIGPRHIANSILDVQIAHLDLRNADAYAIHAGLVSLPEVREWLEKNHLVERTVFSTDVVPAANGAASLAHVSLNASGMTVRQILNRIVASPGFSSWVIGRSGQKGQNFTVGVS
jgi:hypothetical protein